MGGIYIHIPYCRQACNYCNFHFSVSRQNQQAFLDALKAEMAMNADFFDKPLKTIYLGGGTPSLLGGQEIISIFESITKYFTIDDTCEITLEANPDDLDQGKLQELRQTPVNRLSIGIQSFHQQDLKYLNRIHSPAQAMNALRNALETGFTNLTADLIYGIPALNDEMWMDNLRQLISFQIPHISAYALTVEDKTALAHFIRQGKMQPVSDDQCARQFGMMVEYLEAQGFQHYETSNFAMSGHMSSHNLLYWTGKPYLGLGPSAHSYKDGKRFWNVSNTSQYIADIGRGELPRAGEILSENDKLNEYIMTSLRTMWGCDLQRVGRYWGQDRADTLFAQSAQHLQNGLMIHMNDHLILTRKGRFLADGIAAGLFVE